MLHPRGVHVLQNVIHEIDGSVSFAFGIVRHELDIAVIWILTLTGALGFDTWDTVHQLDEIDDTFVNLD
jgi:hypothetical protein